MKKLIKLAIVFGILFTLVLSIAIPVSAISTSTVVNINTVYAYENCLEQGDLLLTVDYTATMSPVPTEPISSTFILRFLDSAGADIRDSLPYSYFNNGYAEGYVSIYFSAADVVSYFSSLTTIWTNLFSGTNYYMRLDGNPSATWTGGGSIPQAGQVASNNFFPKVSSTVGATQGLITQDILAEANVLDTNWNTTFKLVSNSQVGTTYGSVLTSYGTTYFGKVLPNLTLLAPNVLSTKQEPLVLITSTTPATQYANQIGNDYVGSSLDLTPSANALHIGGMWLGIILSLTIDAFVSIQASREVNSYKPFIMLNIPLLYVFTRIHWFPMLLTVGLGLICAIATWYVIFYEKSSA
jgi:hypothetical protein